MPGLHDPFAGGGAIPFEAQRLGLQSLASDLNPVAVLINKAMIEIPAKFVGRSPVHPDARQEAQLRTWKGAEGLAEDVRRYGAWMRDEAEKKIGHLYPNVRITADVAGPRDDLKAFTGRELTVVAWLWARTVSSPNPAFSHVQVPLVSTFVLSSKEGCERWVEPVVSGDTYRFVVRTGAPSESAKTGTRALGRGGEFRCVISGAPIDGAHIKAEARAGRMGARLMAIVADGTRGRLYLDPQEEMERIALAARPEWAPDVEFFQQALGFRVGNYGMTKWSDLFAPRQLVALTTLSDLVAGVRERVNREGMLAGFSDDARPLDEGGAGAPAYADAIATYLAMPVALGRMPSYFG